MIHDEENEDHDPKTCFRCRLHDLWEELVSKNTTRFMLFSLAEAAGSALSQLGPEDTKMFMISVMSVIFEDQEERRESEEATKH